MSHGGGGQPSCTSVSLGKYVRGALRAASGKPKKKKNKAKELAAAEGGVSLELTSSFSTAARKESVVRVVLRSGVVEVYPGVVLACTVIRKHPPGLCLAHPDVFRNPHGSVLRPLEPLFPGQKFLLLPESTVIKLKQKIPEGSIGAFATDDDDDDGQTGSGEEVTSSEGYRSSGGGAASSEEERDATVGVMPACSAKGFYETNEQWSEWCFRELVERGLAVEPSKEEGPPERKGKKAKKKRNGGKRRARGGRERHVTTAPARLIKMVATPRRTWEPSLPSVDEEDAVSSVSSVVHPSSSEPILLDDDHHHS